MAKDKDKNLNEELVAEEAVEEVVQDTSDDTAEVAQDDVPTVEKELAEQKEKFLRLMAEYDNFRKRSAKERSEAFGDAVSKTLTDILPVFDNFERALGAECADETYKSGVEMIFKQFGDVLTKLGVEVINPLGETFDPNVANAVNQIEDDNFGENTVAQVFQKGYKIGDKVIRYAMVVVANP